MKLESFRVLLRNKYIRSTAKSRRKKLRNTAFTIISNNCWGGLVYESYGLEKQTPTVGMFFMAEEYIKFLSNLEHYLFECEMEFVEPEEARHKVFYRQDKRFGSFPIARLEDVEIAILHCHSKEEAKGKWERRCKRIRMDKLIVKMNDQNGCTKEQAEQFCQLPFENKLFFTVHDWNFGDCCVRLPGGGDCVATSREPFGGSHHLDVNRFIDSL